MILKGTFMKQLIERLISRGHNSYDGEQVTQLEHALQTADMVVSRKLSEHLIVSALFHDIGHLIYNGEKFWDNRHQYSGSKLLEDYFPQSIWMPVHLHVEAKRYMCRDNDYFKLLSDESKRSLILQGGIMNDAECVEFENNVFFNDAIALRYCDDNAKSIGRDTNPIEFYIPLLYGHLICDPEK